MRLDFLKASLWKSMLLNQAYASIIKNIKLLIIATAFFRLVRYRCYDFDIQFYVN
jgi:hypothetical protein